MRAIALSLPLSLSLSRSSAPLFPARTDRGLWPPAAPGAYNPHLPEHLPAYSFGLKTPLEKPSDTPAPNAYKPDKLTHAPNYSFGLKTPIEKPSDTPGTPIL